MATETPAGSGPRPRPGADERYVLVGTALLVLTLPAPWYRTDVPGNEIYARGWQGPGAALTVLAALLAVGLSALVIARLREVPAAARIEERVPWLPAVAGGGCLVLLMFRLVLHSEFHSYGLVLGLVWSTAVAFGGFGMTRSLLRTTRVS